MRRDSSLNFRVFRRPDLLVGEAATVSSLVSTFAVQNDVSIETVSAAETVFGERKPDTVKGVPNLSSPRDTVN
jgi:hypothetical protein